MTPSDVLAALAPIWTTKHETARRVRQRISSVMKWAIAKGWRRDDPTTVIAAALPKVSGISANRKALPFAEVAGSLDAVKACRAGMTTKLALELLVLTASQSGEVRLARWPEFDLDRAEWTIPAERMKAKRAHRVPLSPRAVGVLREVRAYGDGSNLVFPGAREGRPLSDMTLSKLVKELGFDADVHGFRTSFRMWAQERTNFPREGCRIRARPCDAEQGRGRLRAVRSLRKTTKDDGGLGRISCQWARQSGEDRMIDVNRPTRKTVVQNVKIIHFAVGDALYPKAFLCAGEEPKDVWWVKLEVRDGLLAPSHLSYFCDSEEAAQRLAETNKIGTQFDDTKSPHLRNQRNLKAMFEFKSSIEGGFGIGSAGDEEFPLAYDVLDKSEIYQNALKLSQNVVDFLGKQRVGQLKSKHRDNYKAAAAFEYCWFKLPHSSATYIAAAYQYHYYITGDEFSAGYLWRDLECLVYGVEAEAVKAIEMRKKAGGAGGKRSAKARARACLPL